MIDGPIPPAVDLDQIADLVRKYAGELLVLVAAICALVWRYRAKHRNAA